MDSKETNINQPSLAYRASSWGVGWLYRFNKIDRNIPLQLTASGQENLLQNMPFLLAFTHHNTHDIPAIGRMVHQQTGRPVHFLAKEELLDESKVSGKALKAMHAIPINRNNFESRPSQLINALRVLKNGGILGIAAEGERVNGDKIASIRGDLGKLAAMMEVAVVPVAVAGPNYRFRGRSLWYVPRSMHVDVGPPILPPTSNEVIGDALQSSLDNAYSHYQQVHGSRAAAKLDRNLT